ncbi:MAG: SRPBCC family protein [Chloroflexi bacterium]|nr:SRPBCC family protein [Chloroflexota bacterium]
MEINRDAPIVLNHEIEIFAPPKRVWERIAQVEYWSEWHPDIGKAYWTDDEPMDRRGFKFGVKMFRFTGQFRVYEEPHLIGWTARHLFSRHRQMFRLSGDYRRTVLTSEASYEGRVAALMPERLREPLDYFGQTWLAAVKTHIESERENGARSPGTRSARYMGQR